MQQIWPGPLISLKADNKFYPKSPRKPIISNASISLSQIDWVKHLDI